ncbi:MAG: hypothetical protein E7612_05455 [Ruminococcaceae bacterium]|nr:hypothetical protein [Oscillospiraceae bacterium]
MNRADFEELISHVTKTPSQTASRLEEHFGSYGAIIEAEPVEIADALDGDMNVAIYVKLAASLVSRRLSDKLTVGQKYTAEEIKVFLVSYFYGRSVETVAVLSIDSHGKIISLDKVSEGTVNFSAVMPRKILEVAKRRCAKRVIIAHNHPGGYPYPSDDDIASATLMTELFMMSGVEGVDNYVVAGSNCQKINLKGTNS